MYVMRIFRACHLCNFNVAANFFQGHPYIGHTTVRHDIVRAAVNENVRENSTLTLSVYSFQGQISFGL